MEIWMRKIISWIAAFVLCSLSVLGCNGTAMASSSSFTVSSDLIPGWPKAPKIQETTGVLLEDSTNTVLYDKGKDERMYPASTTKVLAALVAIENSSLSEEVTFTETGTAEVTADSANIGMQVGEVLTMEQCLYAMLLASANEVSTQVAEHVGGSVNDFVKMMNQKAQELGCTGSHFTNANGLHDADHYTTAYDMARIMQAAIQNETFCAISGSQSYVIPPTNMNPESRELGNHHAMLMPGTYHYDGVFAGKTGNTDEAGNTLLTACRKDGTTLICMVMQSQDAAVVEDTKKLLNYGYRKFQMLSVAEPGQAQEGGFAYVPKDTRKEDLVIQDEIQGDLVYSQYLYQGVPVGTALAAAPSPTPEDTLTQEPDEDQDPSTHSHSSSGNGLLVSRTIIAVLSVLILLGIGLIIKTILQKKK